MRNKRRFLPLSGPGVDPSRGATYDRRTGEILPFGLVQGAVNTAYASPQYTLGIAKETVKGTGVVPAFWMKARNPKFKAELVLINDETLQGSMVKIYDLVQGMRHDTHGWEGYPYLDTFPLFSVGALGSPDTLITAPGSTTLAALATAGALTISTTATIAAGSWIVIDTGVGKMEVHQTQSVSGAGPYTVTLSSAGAGYPLLFGHANAATVTGLTGHKFSLLNNAGAGNQPNSLTLTDFDGEEWRQWAAGQLNKITYKGAAPNLVDYTVDFLANPFTTPGAPTPSFTTEPAAPSWTTMINIGGVVVPYYVSWQVELTRNVKPIPALTGTQQYFMLFADALEAVGKVTVLVQSGAPEIAQFIAGTQQTFDLVFYDVKSGWAHNYHSSKAQFKTATRNIHSNPWVELELDVQFLPTATDATAGGVSPLTMTTANAQAGVY
jgi:hypothetical protein